jgi:microcystin degradation protein MlrC
MGKYRIGIAFFYHESHTFSPVKTTIESFYDEGYFKGSGIMGAYKGTKTEVGGFIDVLEARQIEIVPLLCAAAIPSGTVTLEAYQQIKLEMIHSILEAQQLDGILIALHGAMVVEGISDPETEMLAAIRKVIGDQIPIATTLDMHANIGHDMVNYTPLHFGFKTYPHVDMYEQGVKSATILIELLKTRKKYYASFIKLAMMPPSINMRTAEGPMHDLIKLAKQKELAEDIVSASVFGGFPYSDIPEAGASILVVSTNRQRGDEAARSLADAFWKERERFIMDLPDVKEGIRLALKSLENAKPIVLADISDNPLSGGSGDTTPLLREMIEQNVKDALFGALYDPDSLHQCFKAGEGAELMLSLGGKHSFPFGEPVKVKAQVIKLSDGRFQNKGPMNNGLWVDTKRAAWIRVKDIDILLTGRALSANDPELFHHIGIEPTKKKILGLKVKNHFRAAFEPLVSEIIYIDAPGLASNHLDSFPYKHITHPVWPLDDIDFYEREK